MAKKKSAKTKQIVNWRPRHDYQLGATSVVGPELTGVEARNLRRGHGQLRGAYVTVKDNELWLLNATTSPSSGIPLTEEQQTRTRKLLAKRREIDALIDVKQQGKSIVPLEILTGGRYIKLRIA